jgi:16S rRNA (cytosine1402-N4)-methyltransferase
MVKEVVAFLEPAPGKVLVDCTLGFGGHAEALLKAGASVIGIDRDPEAGYPGIQVIQDNFANLDDIIKGPVDGFLFDLGVSSYQIDEPSRGFSIRSEGPLDMRMDQSRGKTAADLINGLSLKELEKIFGEFGEERFSGRIARRIGEARERNRIETTGQLREIVEAAIPTWRKRESVSRIFQALRIAVNSELSNLKAALPQAFGLLIPGGRIVVISYHSLEDRIVKQAFKNGILKMLTKKPVTPGVEETAQNPRARSAKLRAAEKK